MDRIFYTYLHCKPNGDIFYVGKGVGNRAYKLTQGRNVFHRNIVAKHGEENIKVYVFHCSSEDEAKADEIQQIASLRRDGVRLSNIGSGGEGASGVKRPELAERNRLRKGLPGKKHTEETKAKLRLIMRNKSPESIAKQAAALRGRTIPSEVRKKISEAQKGKKKPPEVIEKRIRTYALKRLKALEQYIATKTS